MSESETALVLRAQDGDRAAFEELVRRTSRLVFARLYLDTGSAHRAEDLLQETLLLAFRSLRRLADPSGFRPWLLTIAHNVLIDAPAATPAARQARAARRDTPLAAVPSAGPSPDEAAQREEAAAQVLACSGRSGGVPPAADAAVHHRGGLRDDRRTTGPDERLAAGAAAPRAEDAPRPPPARTRPHIAAGNPAAFGQTADKHRGQARRYLADHGRYEDTMSDHAWTLEHAAAFAAGGLDAAETLRSKTTPATAPTSPPPSPTRSSSTAIWGRELFPCPPGSGWKTAPS